MRAGLRERVQRFGSFMAGMIIPNIGAFIAWGLIAAFFIPTGWAPNPRLATLVAPTVHYLLPVLLGYTGGKLVHDTRGAVVGAMATMGAVVGAEMPMLIGAMIMGPLGGYLMKRIDESLGDRIPSGFEMLVNNFSAGILAAGLAIAAHLAVGPAAAAATATLGEGVQWLAEWRLLPLAALIIEPAKILFLNNAINHGVLAPLGVAEAAQSGKAIHFLLESNPGPGLGLLCAYWLVGRGEARQSAPGAILIHFFGGIHEIYFPYVLAHPLLIAAMCAGGVTANLWFVVTGAGLVATPSPGSVIAELAMAPKGAHLGVIGGILLGALASFLVALYILKSFPVRDGREREARTDGAGR